MVTGPSPLQAKSTASHAWSVRAARHMPAGDEDLLLGILGLDRPAVSPAPAICCVEAEGWCPKTIIPTRPVFSSSIPEPMPGAPCAQPPSR